MRAQDRHQLRIGDAEREAAVSALGEHYAAGRLTKDEYDERADAAWAARTGSDLHPLFTDLPGAPTGDRAPSQPNAAGSTRRRPTRIRFGVPWLPILIGVFVVVALGHLWPLLIIFGVLWCTGVLRPGRFGHPRGGWPHHRW